ncbi:MAG: MMPL family transporter [Gaiellaceae bacterium]
MSTQDPAAKESPMNTNLAARAGRRSARNWKTALFGWLAFVIVMSVLGTMAGTKKLKDSDYMTGESARATQILSNAGYNEPLTESVLVQSSSATVDDKPFRAAIWAVVTKLDSMPQVASVRSPLGPGKSAISADGHSALVQFDMKASGQAALDEVQPVLTAVADIGAQHPNYTIEEFGQASATYELNNTIGQDFKKAERLTVPATLLILLLAFGAMIAAGLPVILAFSAVLGSIGISALLSRFAPAGDATSSVMLMMGMAVGVDYSLFYLKREREERAAGRKPRQALEVAAATSGQAVLISGGTVLIAMGGMLFAGSKLFTTIGIGTMVVVFAAMIGSLTVLPAMLSKFGNWVDRSFVAAAIARLSRGRLSESQLRLMPRLKGRQGESRFWGAVIGQALRRPLLAVSVSAGALIVAALPALGIHTKLPSFTDLPRDLAIVQTYERIQASFPGAQTPAEVVVRGADVTTPEVQAALDELKRQALASGQMHQPIRAFVNPAGTVVRMEIPLAGSGGDSASARALGTLRSTLIPTTLGRIGGLEYAVTGQTAGTGDFNQTMKTRAPIVFAFVLGFAFLLLLLTFRSIVVPIKAIILNLLSVGASYGILVWIFQEGHLEGLLGFQSNGSIVTWLPMFLFTVLFGLSMDYHVFILSRVKELVDGGMSTEEAVSRGIRGTASTVTAAAMVMVTVFAIFGSLRDLSMKQMGIGLAVAVLLDATVIRGLLLPATMKLLGDWNWYLPRWLEWLPGLRFGHGERVPAQAPRPRPTPVPEPAS